MTCYWLLLGLLLSRIAYTAFVPAFLGQPALVAPLRRNRTSINGSTSLYTAPLQYVGPPGASTRVKCDKAFGSNMNRLSCFDAWQNFQWQDTRKIVFAQRGMSLHTQKALPVRISSGGSCSKVAVRLLSLLLRCTFGHLLRSSYSDRQKMVSVSSMWCITLTDLRLIRLPLKRSDRRQRVSWKPV